MWSSLCGEVHIYQLSPHTADRCKGSLFQIRFDEWLPIELSRQSQDTLYLLQIASWATPDTMGKKFMKAVYRGYSDENFTSLLPGSPSQGMAGPTIHAEVGDKITVVFKVTLAWHCSNSLNIHFSRLTSNSGSVGLSIRHLHFAIVARLGKMSKMERRTPKHEFNGHNLPLQTKCVVSLRFTCSYYPEANYLSLLFFNGFLLKAS